MPIYKYFNASMKSTLFFPELEIHNTLDYDFAIEEVNTWPKLEGPEITKGSFYYDEFNYQLYIDCFELSINKVANFRITQKKITFCRFPKVDDSTLRLYLLASVYGYYLIYNGQYALHAALLGINGIAIAIMGESGAGKSTTLSKCIQEGHQFISDDIIFIGDKTQKQIPIYEGPKRIKVWDETVELLKINKNNLQDIMPNFAKKQLKLVINKSNTRYNSLKKIYYLEKKDVNEMSIESIQGFDKIDYLFKNIYKPEVIELFGKVDEAFELCANLAQSITIKKITRPIIGNSIDEIYQVILNDNIQVTNKFDKLKALF